MYNVHLQLTGAIIIAPHFGLDNLSATGYLFCRLNFFVCFFGLVWVFFLFFWVGPTIFHQYFLKIEFLVVSDRE